MSRLVRLAAAALVAAVVAGAGSLAGTPATAQDSCDGVWVVIDATAFGRGVSVGCAPGSPARGIDALVAAGHSYEFVESFPGLVCRIDGRPTVDDDPCKRAPSTSAYWAYWHAEAGGSWVYSNQGAHNRTPPKGSVEGWAFGAKAKPSVPPPAPPPSKPEPEPEPDPEPDQDGSGSSGGSGSGGSGSTGAGSSGRSGAEVSSSGTTSDEAAPSDSSAAAEAPEDAPEASPARQPLATDDPRLPRPAPAREEVGTVLSAPTDTAEAVTDEGDPEQADSALVSDADADLARNSPVQALAGTLLVAAIAAGALATRQHRRSVGG